MAKAIMIQGTMSSAGKSLLCAGLCRVFRQDGFRVAPFKSQNMALNSYVTGEGLEMGRAQVTQAQAAGVEPSVSMNPILLKPTGDSVSQVIVNGQVRGNYSAADYFAMKRSLIPDIMRAYRSLEETYDIIVIEGAGSPAEINLKENDIVNMGMARLAQAPVLLVGDIDRGGVFAQLYGTVSLLDREEQAYVKGLVINKFRGDVSILAPGLRQIEQLTGKPVLGLLPYLHVRIDEEDSLAERLTGGSRIRPSGAADRMATRAGNQGEGQTDDQGTLVDIAVIRLPHISNFTDFSPLEEISGVTLRYVGAAGNLGRPDLIILPGTKNTMGDLIWLRESGLEPLIRRAVSEGTRVLGICGGYQMLGETLSDPEGEESGERYADPAGASKDEGRVYGWRPVKALRGLGLLPIDTVFAGEKTRTQACGRIVCENSAYGFWSGQEIQGYEIHMGETHLRPGQGAAPLTRIFARTGGRQTEKEDGCVCGCVCGTYLHGLFDAPGMARRLAEELAEEKGLTLGKTDEADPAFFRESQYDLLAQAVREGLDMEAVYRILEQGMRQKDWTRQTAGRGQ